MLLAVPASVLHQACCGKTAGKLDENDSSKLSQPHQALSPLCRAATTNFAGSRCRPLLLLFLTCISGLCNFRVAFRLGISDFIKPQPASKARYIK